MPGRQPRGNTRAYISYITAHRSPLTRVQSFDVPELPQLRLPSAETAVHAASQVYAGVLQPLYCYVRDTLAEDVENITQALKEVDSNFATESGRVGTHDTVEVSRML